METKVFWKSKTLWINVLGGVLVLLEYLKTINVVDPSIIASALVIINIILRMGVDQSKNLTLK